MNVKLLLCIAALSVQANAAITGDIPLIQENVFMPDNKDKPYSVTNIVLNIFEAPPFVMTEPQHMRIAEERVNNDEEEYNLKLDQNGSQIENIKKETHATVNKNQITENDQDKKHDKDAVRKYVSGAQESKAHSRRKRQGLLNTGNSNGNQQSGLSGLSGLASSMNDAQLIIGTFQAIVKPMNMESLTSLASNIPFLSDGIKNINSILKPGSS